MAMATEADLQILRAYYDSLPDLDAPVKQVSTTPGTPPPPPGPQPRDSGPRR
ncbi:hypothetical protein [Streptomyces hokutonensis]|uniref:hypothetical protein n=1 Tax=Streptomyces hokutonensis TaxID=1306990 RepID=UPI0003A90125|nr:hypothetical protein [Streptomyces hokutonensis]